MPTSPGPGCLAREQPVTITEIAESHRISCSHLTKIVQELGAQRFLETTRDVGGMRLLKNAKDINIGQVVRHTETDFMTVECFDPSLNQGGLSQSCKLKVVLQLATASYLSVLDGVILEDLVSPARVSIKMPSSQKSYLVLVIPG